MLQMDIQTLKGSYYYIVLSELYPTVEGIITVSLKSIGNSNMPKSSAHGMFCLSKFLFLAFYTYCWKKKK